MYIQILIFSYLVLLRVIEIFKSKQNLKYLISNKYSQRNEKYTVFFMYLLHIGWFVSLLFEWIVNYKSKSIWGNNKIQIILILLFLFTQLLRFWTLKTLNHRWNIKIISNQNHAIVRTGPYRFIRHPNYLVVILEIFFIPLIFKAFYTAIIFSILNIILLKYRIVHEEEELFKNSKYTDHFKKLPRFIPRL